MTWYRGDPTPAQFRVLAALSKTAKGSGVVKDLRYLAPISTFRAMHRLGMLRADTAEVQTNTFVTLTEHGRNCAQDVKDG